MLYHNIPFHLHRLFHEVKTHLILLKLMEFFLKHRVPQISRKIALAYTWTHHAVVLIHSLGARFRMRSNDPAMDHVERELLHQDCKMSLLNFHNLQNVDRYNKLLLHIQTFSKGSFFYSLPCGVPLTKKTILVLCIRNYNKIIFRCQSIYPKQVY